ncbi:MAG TPA: 23S rRNA (pseudouridine(1915)-N(3))-methyltransferase RlmH [Candidatus Limnocylindria bacterium]|nr:23S rRNA (pseudouridine(1915)-N(3))-methyltransferase RlmH [Candidatus Limnocylindria bacterium]
MAVRIVAVGKMKEKGYLLQAQEYMTRLTRYCKLEQVEIDDERDPGADSPALARRAMDAEAERILARITPRDYVVALCVEGERPDTEAFAALVSSLHDRPGDAVFVIGGSLGLGEAVLARADRRLSLSNLTFPHQLARVVLLEQLYRAYKIRAKERYHK